MGRCRERLCRQASGILFFRLSSLEAGLLLFGVLLGSTALGTVLGRRVRHRSDALKEPFGVLQGALLGLVGLLLAFGLSLAVSRYEDRRANVVSEANAIGTTYLRAQTLDEPIRGRPDSRAPPAPGGADPRPLARPAGPLHAHGDRHRRPRSRERRGRSRRG